MEPLSHSNPSANAPEPIEFDPFEMDWPWPGCTAAQPEASARPAAPESFASDLIRSRPLDG